MYKRTYQGAIMTTHGVGGPGLPPVNPSKGPHEEEKKNTLGDAFTSFFKSLSSSSETTCNSSSQDTGILGRIKKLFSNPIAEPPDQTDGLSNMIDHIEPIKTDDPEKMTSEQRNVFLHISADRIKHLTPTQLDKIMLALPPVLQTTIPVDKLMQMEKRKMSDAALNTIVKADGFAHWTSKELFDLSGRTDLLLHRLPNDRLAELDVNAILEQRGHGGA